jgi:hypothetical protein
MSTVTPGIELHLANTRWVPLRLRKYGSRDSFNVSSAQKIAVEFAKIGEAPLPAIFASRTAPGADWIAGKVPVLVSPADLTARVGSYHVSVTIYDSPTEMTASMGRIEVLPRPVAGMLTLPNGNSYASTNVMAGLNAGAYTIPMGAPVAVTGAGVVLASAAPGGLPCDGLAIADTGPGATCLYIAIGQLRIADWSVVFGSGSLPTGAPELWLSTDLGKITDVEPQTPSYALRQVVGDVGNDPQVLNVAVTSGFVL